LFATDYYFHIGYAHLTSGKPCQDYALSGVHKTIAYAIAADGCSTGGHTDVGSRILALATAQAVRELPVRYSGVKIKPYDIGIVQQGQMFNSMLTLGLSREDMLATCIYAYLEPGGGFVHLQGDGVVAIQLVNGETHLLRYDWVGNMPLYPAYAVDNYAGFISAHGGDVTEKKLLKQHWIYYPDGGSEQLQTQDYTLGEGILGVTLPLMSEELDAVAVFTDGVTQVEGVDWKDAAMGLLSFKTFGGEFAKRRMIRFIKDCQKVSKGPVDDISYAVIKVNTPEPEEVP
jgi:hypothetical protein